MTSETEETVLDLLPCPFCGCARIYERGFRCFECPECRAEGPTKATKAEAVAAWNTRAALSRAPEASREGAAERLAIVAEKPAHLIRWGEGDRLDLQSVLAALSPPSTGGEGEAVALKTTGWAALAQNRNIRLWSADFDTVHTFAMFNGCEVVRLVSPSPEMGEISAEEIAQFLHDEVDLPDKVVSGQWPLHDDDDGYRGDSGYVRLQPRDIVEHYRDAGKRLRRLILSKLKENGLSREELGGSARASRGAAGPSDCAGGDARLSGGGRS